MPKKHEIQKTDTINTDDIRSLHLPDDLPDHDERDSICMIHDDNLDLRNDTNVRIRHQSITMKQSRYIHQDAEL